MVNITAIEEDFLVPTASFEWGPVAAGAVVATGATFFLVVVGAALGLSLAGTRSLNSGHTFLTIGAIYFLAAQGFGFALGGYVTGRLITPLPESEDEHFRADAHGLAVWSLSAVFGLAILAISAVAGLAQAAPAVSQPMAYWADKLILGVPASEYAVRNAEITRQLTADMAHPAGQPNSDHDELIGMVSVLNGIPGPAATVRTETVENGIRAQADTARHTALYLAMWTALALLFGGFAAIASTVMARFHHQDFGFRRG